MTFSLFRPFLILVSLFCTFLPAQSFAEVAISKTSLETLPIQEGGRRKPYLIFAEESLRSLSGKTKLPLEGKTIAAPELITSFWLDSENNYASQPLILISHRPLKETLNLPLQQKLFTYDELSHNEKLLKLIATVTATRAREPRKKLEGLLKEASDVGMRLALFEVLRQGSLFCIVPNPQETSGKWSTLKEWEEAGSPGDPLAAKEAFQLMQQKWKEQNLPGFSQGITQLRQALLTIEAPHPVPTWKLRLEVFYQKAHPFRWSWILYTFAGLLLFFSQKTFSFKKTEQKSWSYRLAWFFAGSGFFLQALGLLSRVIIAGRPPVTNMYESIIWVAFGTILFALIFEKIYHAGIFLLGAIPVAIASLILADSQPMILDPSIHPLTPVLRDNFWLTIHVLTITLSYAAFALSLGIAHVILIRVIFKRKVFPALYNYLYRALQVGVLLLATGTILGGVWANYSWGRFWDWDPKETWALIALLGYLFLLHGRIAGRWGGFGLAIGSILAFLCVLMAWYGVNFVLGAGLHSYGFGTGGFPIVLGFVGVELLLIVAALMRHHKK